MKNLTPLVVATALLVSSCTKTVDNGPGKLVVKVTDDPFKIEYVSSATVKISKIELRKAGSQDANPFLVISTDTLTFDLINLRNGITADLVNLDIPKGTYDMVRLYVDEAGLKIKDQDTQYKVKVPSGQQTGIKIFIQPAISVEGGLTSELLLDFDLSNSFVMRGDLTHAGGVNGFIFKPCIRATNNTTTGRIEGFVSDTSKAKVTNAKVWLKQDTVMATSFTDTLGHYGFLGIPSGTYSLFATKTGYDTVSYTGIKVYSGNKTLQNFVLTKK